MTSRWELDEIYEKVVEFIDGRDIFDIPRQEIWDFVGMHEKRNTFPAQAALRMVCMYELHRMRNDFGYARSVEVRTLRNLWYDIVKPFLNRNEKPEHILQDKWGRKRSQVLSAVLSEMVLSGMCRYKDFRIEDRTRPKRRPSSWDKLEVGRFDEVVLFIEKDSQFPRIEVLADLLGFTVECGKGQQATAAIEGLIDSLERGKSYLVFTVTDYDYYGFLIGQSMGERVETLGIDAEFHRVGVDLDQVPFEKREIAKFLLPMKSDREREWAYDYAIEGKYGLEIEALTAKELRGAIARAVYDYCDPEALYDYLMKKAINGMLDDVVSEVVEALAGDDEDIQKMLEELRELQEKIYELKKKIREKVKPVAEDVLDGNLEDLDDREDFPYEWLEEQIVEGQTYLDDDEYTDASDLKEGLVDMVKAQLEADD